MYEISNHDRKQKLGRPCATLIFERGNLGGTPLEVADVSGSHFRFQHSETSLQHSEMSFQHSEIENFDFSYFEARTCPNQYYIWECHASRLKPTHPLFLDRFPERFLQPQSAVGSFRLGCSSGFPVEVSIFWKQSKSGRNGENQKSNESAAIFVQVLEVS